MGDPAEGYTRGNLRMMAEKKLLKMSDLRMIWKSRPILNGPYVVRADTPAEFQSDMYQLHRAIAKNLPEMFHSVDLGSSIDWVPVKHEDYSVFIDLVQAEAAQRRKR